MKIWRKTQVFDIDIERKLKTRKILAYIFLVAILGMGAIFYRDLLEEMSDLQAGLFSLLMMFLIYVSIIYPFFRT